MSLLQRLTGGRSSTIKTVDELVKRLVEGNWESANFLMDKKSCRPLLRWDGLKKRRLMFAVEVAFTVELKLVDVQVSHHYPEISEHSRHSRELVVGKVLRHLVVHLQTGLKADIIGLVFVYGIVDWFVFRVGKFRSVCFYEVLVPL